MKLLTLLFSMNKVIKMECLMTLSMYKIMRAIMPIITQHRQQIKKVHCARSLTVSHIMVTVRTAIIRTRCEKWSRLRSALTFAGKVRTNLIARRTVSKQRLNSVVSQKYRTTSLIKVK